MKLRRKSRGSLFRHYFKQITITVLLCLFIASFLLIFFFVNFWKSDIISGLQNEASGIEQAVHMDATADNFVEKLSGAVTSLSYASANDIFIVDSTGDIMMCKDMQATDSIDSSFCFVHSMLIIPADVMTEIVAAPDGYTYEGALDSIGKGDYFLATMYLGRNDGTDYYVAVTEASEVAYQPYTTEFLRMIIMTGLIAVLISFFASIVVSYRMSKPIKKITAATKQYAGGDFSVKIPEMHSYDELNSLVSSVNSMADSLSVLEESRSNFVANVSHELKTPMTVISGFVDGMLDGTIDGEDREKYLKIVSDEVKRLSRLVIAMLNMSKIEAGKLTLTRSDVNVDRMIVSILLSLEKVINDKKINIVGLETLEPVTLNADDALINQIIYNIVDNAVKFTPVNGTITFGLVSDKKNATIVIRNSGSGVSEEDAALIFDRFYKADKSRGLDTQSFGMGLYIVKSIVELHGGTITLESDHHSYTEFIITLPV